MFADLVMADLRKTVADATAEYERRAAIIIAESDAWWVERQARLNAEIAAIWAEHDAGLRAKGLEVLPMVEKRP